MPLYRLCSDAFPTGAVLTFFLLYQQCRSGGCSAASRTGVCGVQPEMTIKNGVFVFQVLEAFLFIYFSTGESAACMVSYCIANQRESVVS